MTIDMAKPKTGKTVFYCTECGAESPTWKGQCPSCNAWNTLQEQPAAPKNSIGAQRASSWTGQRTVMQDLEHVDTTQQASRYTSGVAEFDRALGGGLVVGGVVLLGGDPGIGKSTLLTQVLSLCNSVPRLYVTGEESVNQVAGRAKRLELNTKDISILAETNLEMILDSAHQKFPNGKGLLVVDSIQTMFSNDIDSAPGTVTQVRECAARLTRLAKQSGVTVILIGHVTKDGNLAGPRVLEHLVDTVLYFEGDPQSPYRLIRAFKNRFGAAQELGAFEMTEQGLVSIDNPSSMFLNQERAKTSGSCVFAYQEGPRPLLLEVQALMDDMQGGQARRLAVGIDNNRLAMMLGVLHKHGSLMVSDQDVFVNVVGGLKIQEPAVDLAVVFALISSLRERPIPVDLVCFGELGLTGELRPVQRAEDRLKEAARLGFSYAIIPERNKPQKPIAGLEIFGAKTLGEALDALAHMEGGGQSFTPSRGKSYKERLGKRAAHHSPQDDERDGE